MTEKKLTHERKTDRYLSIDDKMCFCNENKQVEFEICLYSIALKWVLIVLRQHMTNSIFSTHWTSEWTGAPALNLPMSETVCQRKRYLQRKRFGTSVLQFFKPEDNHKWCKMKHFQYNLTVFPFDAFDDE